MDAGGGVRGDSVLWLRINFCQWWVPCQLDILKAALFQNRAPYSGWITQNSRRDIRKHVDEIYMTLRKPSARLLWQCLRVAAAVRPLRVEELAEILSMDF